jgi:hypothetical protein
LHTDVKERDAENRDSDDAALPSSIVGLALDINERSDNEDQNAKRDPKVAGNLHLGGEGRAAAAIAIIIVVFVAPTTEPIVVVVIAPARALLAIVISVGHGKSHGVGN